MVVVAGSEDTDGRRKLRKRARPKADRKLLVDERVEVRSVDEGFLGSWSSAIVVASDKKRRRCVRYDHYFTDDESSQLVEEVPVSLLLDGVVSGDRNLQCRGRGNIRPLPPPVPVRAFELNYGLCVDVDYNGCWWEGVIFDHNDGAENRTVFFPDLGDEMKVAIGDLRITQDWDEATGIWSRRGKWVFCKFIEVFEEMRGFLPISVKQIWYDVRGKRDFKKVREWTSGAKDLWRKMVSEVINEYSEFFENELRRRLELMGSFQTRDGLVDSCGVLAPDDSVNADTVTDQVIIERDSESARPGFDVDLAPEEEMRHLDQPLSSEIGFDHGTVTKNVGNGSKTDRKSSKEKGRNSALQKARTRRNTSRSFINSRDRMDETQKACVLRPRKRAQELLIPDSSHRNPRTTLSWLLDNNAVMPRAKVRCIDRRDNRTLAVGRITLNGIKCRCCEKLFSPNSFEIHAGSKCLRGGSDILLRDGRSLLDCKRLIIMSSLEMKGFTEESLNRETTSSQNDTICSVCHYGGDLMLCDGCPSSFHKSCLGLRDIPEGNWFCRHCSCVLCGESKFNREEVLAEDEGFLMCAQCLRKYHVGCLREKQSATMKSNVDGNWFCNYMCRKTFLSLQKLLCDETRLGTNNLTWSLLKPTKTNSCRTVPDDIDTIENYSKLNVAISVMHECFQHVKDPRTRRDIVEDVIFGRGSDLQRLNFRGFYTVVLARNGEFISVATLRVHGKKIAEVPLVCTRIQYRRMGMCRILMNELEKKLGEIGVERLVLPAVPSVLNTWTTSFGFSKVTASERLHFLDYKFLNFQDTIMCQKLLTNIPLAESSPLRGVLPVLNHDICEDGESVDIIHESAVSEGYQVEQIKGGQIANQGEPEISARLSSNASNIATVTVKDTQNSECRPCLGNTDTNSEFYVNTINSKRPTSEKFLKFYERRKKPTGMSLVKDIETSKKFSLSITNSKSPGGENFISKCYERSKTLIRCELS